MQIAVDRPKAVSKLALGSTSPRVDAKSYKTIEKWADLAEKGDAVGLYLDFAEKIYPTRIFEAGREVFMSSAAKASKEELLRFAVLAEGTKDFDLSERLSEIKCPTLVILSEDDRVIDPRSAALFEGSKNFETFVYESGYGHAAYDLAPDYKERLMRFFEE